ncbi:aldehyde dehydrogenase [Polynucleobacter alcilacus]|jgi:acyl-CoA reductase-like NAD-dependent aldehyde dehydrogenase|uniref:aldehyde dehydrogenase n=1 Tax=Polynucleobacter alcilacus TaxID=1819739 RepID=UPI001C0B87F6|nr:aldehyde dehydrogenase [Polynucleobacter alcilacus]MBU3567246.1 aldehyde dehydrogenase [Polynucleobacter alcilacus]
MSTSSKQVPIRGLFIDGKEVPASQSDLLDVLNPATGELLAQISHASDADVDKAVKSSATAFASPEWSAMSNRTRAKLINKLADVFEANLEEIYTLETANNGRSLNETRAQVSRLPDFFRYNAGLAIARRDSVIPVDGNYLNYTIRTPIGVVGNSTPFNHPLMIMVKSLAPTLASGCTTVVKPSEYTPLTTLRLAQLFVDAGLPPGVFNVITGLGPSTGKALAEHPGLAKWVLTGGTEAGRITGALAGSNFAHQTLELGGKTPVLVFDDFNVDQAVNYAAFGAFIGAGQTCICGSRQIVQASIYDEFVEKLAAKAKSIRIGNPIDPTVQLGPVVSARQQQRVLKYIDIGLNEDKARLVAGGKVPTDPSLKDGFFVEPTVFADVTRKMRIFQEEVFGPFVSVTKFTTEEEGLELANDSPFGLAGAIRTNDVTRAHRVAAKLKCGIVWVNDHHRLDPASPWGGIKDSGIGRECGTESFDQHFETKSVMVRLDDAPFDWYKDTASQPRLN